MQLFGEKYESSVRILQIAGSKGKLDGYSMELCGGTHARATGELGQFRILSESAVAAGVRRIEAVTGMNAYQKATRETSLIHTLAARINSPVGEFEHKFESILEKQKTLEQQLKSLLQQQAVSIASNLINNSELIKNVPAILSNLGECDSDHLVAVIENLRSRFSGVIVLAGNQGDNVILASAVSKDFISSIQANKIIQTIAPLLGGKGGGKPDFARGGGKNPDKVAEALIKVKELL